jgi:hypothetical protein
MAAKYMCSGCENPKVRGDFHEAHYTDRERPVTSRCRECRSEDYFKSRYKTVCAQCRRHRPLDQNRVCKKCNEESALRECRGPCGSLLPALISFDGKRTTCKSCRKLTQPGQSWTASGASAAASRPRATQA